MANLGCHMTIKSVDEETAVADLTSEVIPGATVSIVLKADQLTGRQVQGEVQDVLTRGNHPRGIKVRLKDGRVGRVQKIVEGISPSIIQNSISNAAAEAKIASVNITDKKRDTRLEEADYQSEPPPRTLAAFFPSVEEQIPDFRSNKISVETVKCPFCGDFEGDEVAMKKGLYQQRVHPSPSDAIRVSKLGAHSESFRTNFLPSQL
ncbi:hypothetical protein M433DRAFT_133468 [Acidomyces richmondensis BFW]|nr:hypothetical protein M433DRAFT_133468 [Acidomyces richmondensis BFW]